MTKTENFYCKREKWEACNSSIAVVYSNGGHFSKFAPKAPYDEIENDDANEILLKNILGPYNYY